MHHFRQRNLRDVKRKVCKTNQSDGFAVLTVRTGVERQNIQYPNSSATTSRLSSKSREASVLLQGTGVILVVGPDHCHMRSAGLSRGEM